MKILKSLVIIIAMVAMVAGATNAYFSSTVTSPGNTFGIGTMVINVNGQSPTASAVFSEANLAPGQVISERAFVVNNTGSLNGNHLDLEVTLSGDTALAQYIVFSDNDSMGLRFGATTAGNQSVKLNVPGWTAGDAEYRVRNGMDASQIMGPNANTTDDPELLTGSGNGMDRDGDGKVTLADLAFGKIRIAPRNIGNGIYAGTTATLWMNAKVDSAMGDTMQGKTVSATFTWTLHQDASQF